MFSPIGIKCRKLGRISCIRYSETLFSQHHQEAFPILFSERLNNVNFEATVYLMAVWAVFVLFKALAETVIASLRVIPEKTIEATLVRLSARLIGFLAGT